jgi:hypothetical protein
MGSIRLTLRVFSFLLDAVCKRRLVAQEREGAHQTDGSRRIKESETDASTPLMHTYNHDRRGNWNGCANLDQGLQMGPNASQL